VDPEAYLTDALKALASKQPATPADWLASVWQERRRTASTP
jgi:hypothetical protein